MMIPFDPLFAAFRAMFSANELFPIAGLAARIMRSERWKPPVILSISVKPEGTPVTSPSEPAALSIISTFSIMTSLMCE